LNTASVSDSNSYVGEKKLPTELFAAGLHELSLLPGAAQSKQRRHQEQLIGQRR
jgi:hypothetical protein